MTAHNTQQPKPTQYRPFWRILAQNRRAFGAVVLFGGVASLLALSGPIFALQIYDRVLNSRSEETLLVLCVILSLALVFMGLIDHIRRRILAHVGADIANALTEPVCHALVHNSAQPPAADLNDLNNMQTACGSAAVAALLDILWTPLFLVGLFLFHPFLGWWAVCVAFVAMLQSARNWRQCETSDPGIAVAPTIGVAASPGPKAHVTLARDKVSQRMAGQPGQDRDAGRSVLATTLRAFVQSMTIALAALLVLRGALTPGAILAATVLMARFMAPFDAIVAQTSVLKRGLAAAHKLALVCEPSKPQEYPATRPPASIKVRNLTVTAPDRAQFALSGLSFDLPRGRVLGVIGPNGAGKSALLAALAGRATPTMGTIHPRPQAGTSVLVPQTPMPVCATLSALVSAHHPGPHEDRIWQAIKVAGLSDWANALPLGLETPLNTTENTLSAGQWRMVHLAQIAYQAPRLILLDEPTQDLDAQALARLRDFLRRATENGTTVIIATNKPSALFNADFILALDKGRQTAFGPAADVLAATTHGQRAITRPRFVRATP